MPKLLLKWLHINETIIFNPDEIDLGTINLIDKYGNKGLATGRLYHNFFKDFQFDGIRVETDKMLLLNTTKTDNIQFYGRVMGSASMSINGPITDMRMNIDGKPSNVESDSSHIYIPSAHSAYNKESATCFPCHPRQRCR